MEFEKEVFQYIQSIAKEEVIYQGNIIHLPSQSIRIVLKTIGNSKEVIVPDAKIIWEDQWFHKKHIIKSRIQSLLGITQRVHGRKTTIQRITQPEADVFLNANHLIGATTAKTKLALKFNDQIAAIATFSGPTKMKRNDIPFKSYEMIRYCNAIGITVTGGLSKLLDHFIDLMNPDDIMTYIDLEWSSGKSFEQQGFTITEHTPPQQFVVDSETMIRTPLKSNSDTVEGLLISNAGNVKMIRFLK